MLAELFSTDPGPENFPRLEISTNDKIRKSYRRFVPSTTGLPVYIQGVPRLGVPRVRAFDISALFWGTVGIEPSSPTAESDIKEIDQCPMRFLHFYQERKCLSHKNLFLWNKNVRMDVSDEGKTYLR